MYLIQAKSKKRVQTSKVHLPGNSIVAFNNTQKGAFSEVCTPFFTLLGVSKILCLLNTFTSIGERLGLGTVPKGYVLGICSQ